MWHVACTCVYTHSFATGGRANTCGASACMECQNPSTSLLAMPAAGVIAFIFVKIFFAQLLGRLLEYKTNRCVVIIESLY